jgi:glucose 1-dehydrogenase/3-oxoacyl-[acyl-carrier protein] reductase
MRLEDHVVLVTGASRGIGRAIALECAREGADVAVNFVSQLAQAEAVVAEIGRLGRRAVAVGADVSKREEVDNMVERVWSELGPIDALVNNAGIETIIPFLELSDDDWDRVTQVNLKGSWLCSQVVVARVVRESRRAAIVNIGSIQAGLALPGRTHYAPTKRGLEALTRNLAAELAPHGIRVNCVHPGVIETDMTQWVTGDAAILDAVVAKIPLARTGQPEECGAIVALLASADASYITGQHVYVDGGMVVV